MAVIEVGKVIEGSGLGTPLRFAGTPLTGTFPGVPKGALVIDTTNGLLYQNTGTPGTPAWTKVGLET